MSDFGGLVHATPREVARPACVAEVVDAMRDAARRRLPVAPRGRGHSTYGHAQVDDGIVLELGGLDRVDVRDGRAVAGAGATWRDVLAATLPHGLAPPVLTDYLDLSVGGTLSAGGIGGTTHRHGAQVDNVLALRVVTGAGDLVACSHGERPDLFDAVRAGLGQCGAIVEATLALQPAPERVRRYRLAYDDVHALMADQRRLVAAGQFAYVEGRALPAEDEPTWRYVLEAAAHEGLARPTRSDPAGRLPHDDPTRPARSAPADPLAGLRHDPARLEVDDLTFLEAADWMADSVADLRALGQWARPHPWWSAFLPDAATDRFVGDVMASLTAADLGTGVIVLYPVPRKLFAAPMLRLPDDPLVFIVALLRTASPGARPPERMLAGNETLHERARAAGGVRYPIDAVPFTRAQWAEHFGPEMAAAKRAYDPHGLLFPH